MAFVSAISSERTNLKPENIMAGVNAATRQTFLDMIKRFSLCWKKSILLEKIKIYSIIRNIAPIAQLVEQLPFKETVVGSNPTGRTILCLSLMAAPSRQKF